MGMIVASLKEKETLQFPKFYLKPLKGTEERLQEDASKSDNVFGQGQELCHGLFQVQY